MRTRLYSPDDYTALKGWWGKRWGHAPACEALPLSGMIVEDGGTDRAAGWLYLDMTTKTAVIAFVVTCPLNTPRQSARALEFLINGLKHLAESQGRSNLLAACPAGSLAGIFRKCGFESRDTGMEHLTLNLN